MINDIFLSVIVPAFNEERRIGDTLYAIKDYLETRDWRSEVLVIDDGSKDLTAEVVRVINHYGKEIKSHSEIRLVLIPENKGKGYAISQGILQSSGQYILFTDADLSSPIEESEKLIKTALIGDFDLVLGSRKLPGAIVSNTLKRSVMSDVFSFIVRIFLIKGIYDTQCGFKLYKGISGKQLAKLQKVYDYTFDVEHLYIAQKTGLKIKEVPVIWIYRPGSKVHPFKDSVRMLLNLVRIRFLHRDLS